MNLHIHDKRSVKLEKVFAGDFIPFFGGRPSRTDSISKDDEINLKIALHSAKSMEEFLGAI